MNTLMVVGIIMVISAVTLHLTKPKDNRTSFQKAMDEYNKEDL